MGIKVKVTGDFGEAYDELVKSEPELLDKIDSTVELFGTNPKDTRLGVHALMKRMKGKWAMGIMGDESDDLRIVFEWLGSNSVRLIMIGPHPLVYARKRLGAK